jgi:hypothetical protein
MDKWKMKAVTVTEKVLLVFEIFNFSPIPRTRESSDFQKGGILRGLSINRVEDVCQRRGKRLSRDATAPLQYPD